MAYIRLPGRFALDIENPRPEQLPSLSVLVRAIGREHRFSNMADVAWTVLDHSLHVHRILTDVGATKGARLGGLFHDMAEGPMHDLASPYKRRCPAYKVLENRLLDAIYLRFGVCSTGHEGRMVKWADRQALAIEANYCLGIEERELVDWGWEADKDSPLDNLPWTDVLRGSAELRALYGWPPYRDTAPATFLHHAQREGAVNVNQ